MGSHRHEFIDQEKRLVDLQEHDEVYNLGKKATFPTFSLTSACAGPHCVPHA